MMSRPGHLDYADEAESAERAEAWPQALALWKWAIETCPSNTPQQYGDDMARCERQIAIDAELASIARHVFVSVASATSWLAHGNGGVGDQECVGRGASAAQCQLSREPYNGKLTALQWSRIQLDAERSDK